MKFLNVDLFSYSGIKRAIKIGLGDSDLVDVAISPNLHAISNLFTAKNQGKAFVLLRHPIERLLEKYINTYKIEPNLVALRNLTKNASENNYLTRQLSNGQQSPSLTTEHLEIAKIVLRSKFLIGFTEKINESFHRFRVYFGWTNISSDTCEKSVLNLSKLKNYAQNLNEKELKLMQDSNSLDLQLYKYAETLFEEQVQFFGN